MKLSFNGLRSIFLVLACYLAAFVQVNAQGTNVKVEAFPNVYNNNATGNINSTFVGSMGTWSAYSNKSYASVAVVSYYQNATPNSLFIKNFKGSSASSSIATSPSIDLSSYTCAPNATLIFNVDPSKLSGSNNGTIYTIDYSNNGGSTWTTMVSQTAAQIKAALPVYGWNLGTLDIPASYLVSNFKFRITGSSPANSSYDNEIYFDDLNIFVPNCASTGCTGNLLNNPGFEAATNFDAWDSWGSPTITTDEYSGVKAASVASSQYGFAQSVTGTTGKIYTLQAYAKNSGAGSEWNGIGIKFLNSSWSVIQEASVQVSGTTYQLYSQNYTAPSGTAYVQVYFYKNAGSSVIKLDDFCLTESTVSITTCNSSTSFNPFSDANGFNVFTKGALEFKGGEVEGAVAGGGNLTLNGASRIAINNSGSYPNAFGNSSNYSLVVGGRMYYTSGGVSYINNGFLNLASTTGTTLWAKDPNNANVNLRATSNAQSGWNGYNSQPALQVQQQQTVASATSSSGLNFASTFTDVVANANLIASYSAASPCNASLNIISISGTSPSITLVDNKINVINITGSYFSTLSQITFNNKPTATRPVIFNISGTAGYTFNNFQAVGISNNDAPYILYNFSAVTGTIQMNGGNTLYGSVLIPNGKFIWNNSNNVEGQILANLFTLNAGEIHYNPYNVCLPICTVTYSLGDFVWYDVNNNGIQDAGEPGVNGVTVKLYADANADNIPDGAAIATTTTNASGAYSFNNLPVGKYVVAIVVPSGYSIGTTTGTSSNPNNSTTNDNNGVAVYNTSEIRTNNINLTANNNNIDLGLTGTGSIGDFVWNDVNQNGIQNSGETGIQGVTVTITYPGGNTASTTTNASGAYSFTNLAPGNYTISFTTPSGYAASASTQGSDTTKDSNPVNGDASVTLTAGQNNTTIDAGFYSTACTGRVTSLYFNKLDGGSDIEITEGSLFSPAQLNSLYNMEIGFTGSVGSVLFTISGPTPSSNIENAAPYNSPGTGGSGWNGSEGNYSVNIKIYSNSGATGTICHDTTINFTYSSVCIKHTETFPNQYNTGFSKPITNGTFTGSTGTFTVNSSSAATIVVTTPYYSPSTSYAIKVVNWATTTVAGTTSVVSPKINLSTICCPSELKLEYKLWTYTVNSADNTTTLSWEFSNDNGSTWNVMNTITPAQIKSLYGENTVVTLSIPVPVMYQNSNFRYRIKSNKPTNSAYDFYVFIDDITVSSPSSCGSTYTLGDYVWFDVNNNGIQNAGEPGIGNVTVNLYYDLNNDNIPDGSPIATTTTDASGAYSFTGLSSNRYIVSVVEPTGYDAATTTGTSADPNNSTTNDNNGVAIYNTTELRSNSINLTATNNNVDFGLKGTLNLGNLVWNDTNGNGVKNTFESGVNGVTVYLYQDANGDNVPDGAAIATTTTAGGGLYSFSNLVPGNYIVGIAKPTGYTKSLTPVSGNTPNNNTDNDNNGVFNYSGIIRSNFITLSVGGEPASGIDGDGTNGNLTLDFAIAKDTDGDDIPDVIDIDDDNDGITDMNESGGYDPLADCDNDGIPNYLDTTPGCSTPSGNDPWGVAYKPLVFTDCNADGINDFFDWDRDGIINELDLDSDNDGILDVYEARPNGVQFTSVVNGMITGTDADENGLLSSAENGNTNPVLNGLAAQDMDRDGTPNFLDLDSDGDGITDLTEALGVYSTTGVVSGTDTDGDGVRAENFSSSAASVADNVNGFGARGILLLDSDNDGKPNAYDIDSDNDGITDNAEGQATCSNKLPTGTDCDGDGVDDSYDAGGCTSCLRTSGGITPFDKDGDGTPDYLDLDTDNDGALDIYEGHSIPSSNGNVPPINYWIAQMGDADKDGLYDYFDGFNIVSSTSGSYWRNVINNNMGNSGIFDTGTGATGSISQLPKSQVSSDCNVGDRDWRNIVILPVSLIDFNGNLNNNIAKLNWSVTNEINMNQYSIERSSDGINFNTVATVNAGSNVTSVTNYTVSDNLAGFNGQTVYYRLKMIEKNGSFKNSKTISFKLNATVKDGINLMPNPAISFVNIKVSAIKDGTAAVKIVDMLGRTVLLQNNKVLTGVNTFSFNNLSTLSAGTYSVQVMVDGTIYNEKLIINR